MMQPAFVPCTTSMGAPEGRAEALGAIELAEQDITGPKENIPVGRMVGLVKGWGDVLVKVVRLKG